ncbi:GntR family transcriptional regulator [Microterricola viridarii]|uniref:DNA-binding transcriptional regulator, GntR family n=1 Tax=Microterricola viridarii TaxID=412690 RepID=A0A1H1ZHC8_9MICO|nr:GntR family transcriptional regulator [Microterricola viridarii]SDT32967.1 DNA-binding transcriptional regulator, GntR family [Microterricola viridarii]
MTGVPHSEGESARVTRILREEIIGGARGPGSRLVEREIAAALGVSRVPVREALRVLLAEGLVSPRPNSWMTVRQFSERDIEELFEMRAAIDSLAFALAARNASASELARLALALSDESKSAANGDAAASRAGSAAFHEIVIEISGNSLLAEIWRTLSGRMRWLLGQHDHPIEMHEEHARLYAALASHDEEAAAALALAHLETSRRAFERHLALEPDDAAQA